MKVLFIGGVKSGKSRHAESRTLKMHHDSVVYLATSEPIDEEMKKRIARHQEDRSERFLALEEPLDLVAVIEPIKAPLLIECMTVWMNNMLYHGLSKEDIFTQVQRLLSLDKEIVFVQNDVGSGIIPDNALAREFVDISGRVSQMLGDGCDEVYHCIAGIATKIK